MLRPNVCYVKLPYWWVVVVVLLALPVLRSGGSTGVILSLVDALVGTDCHCTASGAAAAAVLAKASRACNCLQDRCWVVT